MSSDSSAAERTSGFAYAFAAYVAWGGFPLYWKQLAHVPPVALVSHRVVWSFLFVAGLLTLQRRWPETLRVLRNKRALAALLLTTTLISVNWGLYIWAVNSGRVMEGSLGYYINPLANIVLARLFLGERLRGLQVGAVALAALGVLNLAVGMGQVPWVALALAGTFSLYGLVRKLAPVESLTGLAVETGLAAPVGLGVLLLGSWEQPVLGATPRDTLLLVGSGVATALPLLWFALAARRIRYSTLGIIQYVAPTLQLALAVLVYGEAFTSRHAITFACLWTAVALYAFDGLWKARVPAPAPARQGT
ncbi:EamA family transporter RarD [Archangium lansingense]|uniref:EamA family transporter RarD n=1 Tax=Archangium lansingense TaxID=2995310 RepID=A0ABT3ZVE0_9BACT|nr:EamA family transporter RarD [Archangium lansinium]MCY1073358.1 EamA family transporter RarD [Archangium lansinium]